jgi:hypothetical protein
LSAIPGRNIVTVGNGATAERFDFVHHLLRRGGIASRSVDVSPEVVHHDERSVAREAE